MREVLCNNLVTDLSGLRRQNQSAVHFIHVVVAELRCQDAGTSNIAIEELSFIGIGLSSRGDELPWNLRAGGTCGRNGRAKSPQRFILS